MWNSIDRADREELNAMALRIGIIVSPRITDQQLRERIIAGLQLRRSKCSA